jgi:hypothetical protein
MFPVIIIIVIIRELGYLSWYSDRLLAGWPVSDSQQEQDFFFYSSAQTDPGVHPASCLLGTVGSISGVKQLGHGDDLPHLMPKSRIVDLHLRSPIYFHGTMFS